MTFNSKCRAPRRDGRDQNFFGRIPGLPTCFAWGIFTLSCLFLSGQAQPAEYDLVLRGGRVVDGTGNPAYFADVAVRKGRIAAIGNITGQGQRELLVRDLIVAPGFIDVHTHAENIEKIPRAENFLRMGVTTLVLGNCGGSKLPLGKFFEKLERMTFSPNIVSLVGHGTVRKKAMGGSFNRPPSPAELETMRQLISAAMRDGAVGLSTGLIYAPGEFASTEEIIELAKVTAHFDGIYVSHMRNEGTKILEALNELFTIAREAGTRAHISHIKVSGQAPVQAASVLAAIDAARASGLEITQDQYVYTASSTDLAQLIPHKYREEGKFKERLADPSLKFQMIADMKAELKDSFRRDYSYAVVASFPHDPSLNGLNVAEAASKTRGSDSIQSQIEFILEIEKQGGAKGVFHGMSEEKLQQLLQHPNTVFGSDSSVRLCGEGVPHPRGYGNNARVVSRYVRGLKLLTLEEAVRRMTSLPASVFRLKDRGALRVGAWADMTIFDPSAVQDQATYKTPHQYATGFSYVLVNGKVVVEHDQHTGERPGQILRHGSP